MEDYWYDPRIHNFGNIGFSGRLHALMAPLATVRCHHPCMEHSHRSELYNALIHAHAFPVASLRSQAMIDMRAYQGVDIRKCVHSGFPKHASVLDLCCGTGFSTARKAIGVDTSDEMLDMVSSACH